MQIDDVVNTPNATYTVKQLIGLIEAAQNARMGIDSDTIGKALLRSQLIMPQGKGTYGTKKGRPPKKKKNEPLQEHQ